jgi:hypothetical protein
MPRQAQTIPGRDEFARDTEPFRRDLRGADEVHRAFGLAVLTVTATGIARIVVFGGPGLVTRFGFPALR